MQRWEPPKTSKEIQPHLCKHLDFMCIYSSTYVDRGHSYNPGQERGKAKDLWKIISCFCTWCYQGRQTASLMSAKSKALQPQPAGDKRILALRKYREECKWRRAWFTVIWNRHEHLSEARREPPRCWPSTFQLISINTASKRARFVFKVLSEGFIKGWDVAVMRIWGASGSAH